MFFCRWDVAPLVLGIVDRADGCRLRVCDLEHGSLFCNLSRSAIGQVDVVLEIVAVDHGLDTDIWV